VLQRRQIHHTVTKTPVQLTKFLNLCIQLMMIRFIFRLSEYLYSTHSISIIKTVHLSVLTTSDISTEIYTLHFLTVPNIQPVLGETATANQHCCADHSLTHCCA